MNTLCGQNSEFFHVKAGHTYSNHFALKGQNNIIMNDIVFWDVKPCSLEKYSASIFRAALLAASLLAPLYFLPRRWKQYVVLKYW